MSARLHRTTIILQCLGFFFLSLLVGSRAESNRKDVVIIAVDDMRPELGSYGCQHMVRIGQSIHPVIFCCFLSLLILFFFVVVSKHQIWTV